MKKSIPGAAALVALMAVPAVSIAAATAPAPRFPSTVIVPNTSLGGLVLGGTAASARNVFGAKQCTSGGCSYSTTTGVSANVLLATTKAHKKPFVASISISVPAGTSSPLAAFRTDRGIGIGSTAAQAKKAYPHAQGSAKLGFLDIVGPHNHGTTFSLSDGKVTSISMHSVRLG